MNAETQAQTINDLIQVIKEIRIFENNVATSLNFYRKDKKDSYKFLKQFN